MGLADVSLAAETLAGGILVKGMATTLAGSCKALACAGAAGELEARGIGCSHGRAMAPRACRGEGALQSLQLRDLRLLPEIPAEFFPVPAGNFWQGARATEKAKTQAEMKSKVR